MLVRKYLGRHKKNLPGPNDICSSCHLDSVPLSSIDLQEVQVVPRCPVRVIRRLHL